LKTVMIVMRMKNVRLITVRTLDLELVVSAPAQERKMKAKAAIHFMAMMLSASVIVHVGPAQIMQGRIAMERVVIMMENVRLITVRTLELELVVQAPVQKRKMKAKAAIHFMAMMLSASMLVNVGPAQIITGRIVMERIVIMMENVRLVTVRDLELDGVVQALVQEREMKAKAAIDGLAMMLSAFIIVNVGPAQVGGGSFIMEGVVILTENVTLMIVDLGMPLQLVVLERVTDDLKSSGYCC